MVSWEDCARNKGSSWGPCISDMTLRVNDSCMPVIRQPNFQDKTWDVKMKDIPIVVGNHTENAEEKLETISLSDYLEHFSDFMTNDHFRKQQPDMLDLLGQQIGLRKRGISLLSNKENGDSHVIMSSQACFLPIIKGEETKFNVALYNYQSQPKNPAVLVIVSTSKGSSAQIIEGREQHLLFNHNGKKADFVGERVSDVRRKKGQTNLDDKVLSKEEKQDNMIVIVQVPLKKKEPKRPKKMKKAMSFKLGSKSSLPKLEFNDALEISKSVTDIDAVNVEAAMVSVAERTKPYCICHRELQKYQVRFAYNGNKVACDECGKSVDGAEEMIYHCAEGSKSPFHPNGYDLCIECGDKQLIFDELRGILETKKEYNLQRDQRFPVRVTLQYYKATDNGAINGEIMDDIVKQLEASQKQADFMGSLVTEYDTNRPTEWYGKPQDDSKEDIDDEYVRIRNALEKHCGKNWRSFVQNFENEEVTDKDLKDLNDDELKQLIPKMGPRKRFKKWMKGQIQ